MLMWIEWEWEHEVSPFYIRGTTRYLSLRPSSSAVFSTVTSWPALAYSSMPSCGIAWICGYGHLTTTGGKMSVRCNGPVMTRDEWQQLLLSGKEVSALRITSSSRLGIRYATNLLFRIFQRLLLGRSAVQS